MSNKWNYNERYMHAQNQPEWADKTLFPSKETIGSKGCFMSCLTYIRSRRDYGLNAPQSVNGYEIPDQVTLIGSHRGFLDSGDTVWAVVQKYMGLRIAFTRTLADIIGNRLPFEMRNVFLKGKNNKLYSHWVVVLRGGLCYDPMRTNGQFVHLLSEFPPVPGNNRRFVG